MINITERITAPVSYTHLDVYKRQIKGSKSEEKFIRFSGVQNQSHSKRKNETRLCLSLIHIQMCIRDRFVDEEPDKRKNDWKLNDRWAWFIGDNRQSLKLTTKPEPYTLDRTLRWVQRQVAPTLKMLKRLIKETVQITWKQSNSRQSSQKNMK